MEPQGPDLFKQLVWDPLVDAAIAALFVEAPFLGWGPLGIFVRWLIKFFADKLYVASKTAIDMQRIVLNNEAHRHAYEAASIRLMQIGKLKGVSSPEFKAARDADAKALSVFVQFATH